MTLLVSTMLTRDRFNSFCVAAHRMIRGQTRWAELELSATQVLVKRRSETGFLVLDKAARAASVLPPFAVP